MMGKHNASTEDYLIMIDSGAVPNGPILTYATSIVSNGGTTAYNNQFRGMTQVTSPPQHQNFDERGFRKPTGYRRFDARIEPGAFSNALFRKVGSTTIKGFRSSSMTPVSPSVGLSNLLPYHGTKSLGGVRFPDVSLNMKQQAKTECLNKLTDGSWNMAVSIAESRQTFNLIADSLRKIAFARKLIRGRKFGQAARMLGLRHHQGLSDNWLSYQYGWLPLLSDIKGAFDLLTRKLNKPDLITAFRRVTKDYGPFIPPSTSNAFSYSFSGTCKIGVEVKVWASLDDPTLALLNGLGLTNPLLVAWEKLPWSFIIDWLAPVGNVLSALSSTLGCTFYAGYMTEKSWCNANISYFYIPTGWSLAQVGYNTPCNLVLRNQCMYRSVFNDWPSAGFYIKSPFSTTHVANALALVVSNFKVR